MPKGNRPTPRVRYGKDVALNKESALLNGEAVSDGRARVAVGDRALAAAKSARTAELAARTPAPAAARPAAVQPQRDLLKDGANALVNNRERLRRQEEEATGEKRQNYAAGGYVTKAKTLNTPACAKGRRK